SLLFAVLISMVNFQFDVFAKLRCTLSRNCDGKLSTYPHTIDILNEKRDQKVGFCASSLYEEQQLES
ncbi:hypothetical protein QUB75_15600, partial [Microcoleus sp. K1-B6]